MSTVLSCQFAINQCIVLSWHCQYGTKKIHNDGERQILRVGAMNSVSEGYKQRLAKWINEQKDQDSLSWRGLAKKIYVEKGVKISHSRLQYWGTEGTTQGLSTDSLRAVAQWRGCSVSELKAWLEGEPEEEADDLMDNGLAAATKIEILLGQIRRIAMRQIGKQEASSPVKVKSEASVTEETLLARFEVATWHLKQAQTGLAQLANLLGYQEYSRGARMAAMRERLLRAFAEKGTDPANAEDWEEFVNSGPISYEFIGGIRNAVLYGGSISEDDLPGVIATLSGYTGVTLDFDVLYQEEAPHWGTCEGHHSVA